VVAQLEGISGFGLVTIVGTDLESIEIVPRAVTVPAGDSTRLQALGQFSNGDLLDISDQVVWSTEDPSIATVSNAPEDVGTVRGIEGGSTRAIASLDDITAVATVTVTEAQVIQLSITPPVVETPAGGNVRLRASAVLSDDIAIDVTSEALWVSDDPEVADIRQVRDTIQLEAISAGVTTVRATYGGVTATASITVTTAVLQSLDVTPAVLTIPAGNTRQIFLVGTYSDQSRTNLTFQAQWRTSNAEVAIVGSLDQAGFLTARAPGVATITAEFDGQTVDVAVIVTDAELVAIQTHPPRATVPAGNNVQLSCFGVYSDNSLRGLTQDAAWSSLADDVAAVSNAPGEQGLVTGVTPGNVGIRARFEGLEDTASIEVTEEEVITVYVFPFGGQIIAGRFQNFNAFATYSNGATRSVTDQAVWTSNRSGVAQVSNAENTRGRVTGIEPGQARITAAFDGQRGEANVRVVDAELEELFIFPMQVEVSPGTSQQIYAIGVYSNQEIRQNLTWEVQWSSENPEIVSVGNFPRPAGLVTGGRAGTATVTGELDGIRGSVRVRVVDRELVGLTISPPSAILPVDAFQLFIALAEYDDGATLDVTNDAEWDTTNAGIVAALRFRPGLVNTVREGEANVLAEFGDLVARARVVVRDAEPTAVIISPVNPILNRRGREPAFINFYATAVYPDDSTSDVTQLCTWTSSDPSTVLIFDELGYKGAAWGLDTGSSEIGVRCGEFEASTVATVR
jgi:hypothetical protein